jgi:hypothetical protein
MSKSYKHSSQATAATAMDDADEGLWRGPFYTLKEMEWEADEMLNQWCPGNDVMETLRRLYKYGTEQFTLEHALVTYEDAAMKVVEMMAISEGATAEACTDAGVDMAFVKHKIDRLFNCVLRSYNLLTAVTGWKGEAQPRMTCQDAVLRYKSPAKTASRSSRQRSGAVAT